jgi:hypothetical protein
MSQHHNDDDDSNDAVYSSKAGLSSPAGEQDGVGLTVSSSSIMSMPATPTTHSSAPATAASASAIASATASASASASAAFATQFFSSVRHQQRVLAQQQLVNAPRVGQWRMKDRVTNERAPVWKRGRARGGEEKKKKGRETWGLLCSLSSPSSSLDPFSYSM